MLLQHEQQSRPVSPPRATNHTPRTVGSNNNTSRMKWLKFFVRDSVIVPDCSLVFFFFFLCASAGCFETELGHRSVGGWNLLCKGKKQSLV